MIKAQSLTYRYPDGTLALENCTLEIGDGEFVAVIGRSGAGKTTLLRLLNGALKATSGELVVLNHHLKTAPASDLRSVRRDIGFIFQQFNLVKNISVLENVLAGRLGFHGSLAGILGLYSEKDRKLASQALKDVDLDGRLHSHVEKLSGGQQQRVAIARALVQEPKMILADEPMASLDPRLSETVLELLKDFNEKQKKTVVVNIHVLELARRFSKRVIGLNKGHVVFDGPVAHLNDAVLKEIYD